MSSDHDARLERRYRRLLLAYPRDFRRERSDEVVSTLLAAAEPGRTAPSIAEVGDLVYNGIRTRARVTRRTLGGAVAADALRHAAVASLIVATAAAVAVVVGVSLLGQPVFYREPYRAYPPAVRGGLGLVLATFPAALGATWAKRPHLTRWLATLGAIGSVGFASWLAIRSVHTQTERLAAIRADRWAATVLPYESLEPSNLFGLVTLLCVPAVLLHTTRSASADRLPLGRGAALAASLATLFLIPTTADPLLGAFTEVPSPNGGSIGPPRPAPLHDTGLTVIIGLTLGVIGLWHVLVRRRSRDLAVAWAMTIPALGYATGTFVTPMFFRPGISDWAEGFGPHLLEVTFAAAAVALLASWSVASMRDTTGPPASGS